MKKKFKIAPSCDGKCTYISGPVNFNLSIEIDTDDVDIRTVRKQAKMLMDILEQHWPACE